MSLYREKSLFPKRYYLLCDGKIFSVPQNLYNALRRLHNQPAVNNLRVHYLCINQSDVEQWSQQLQIMGLFDRLACYIPSWLEKRTYLQ